MQNESAKSWKVYVALMIALFFWGSAFVAIREVLFQISPGELALYRYLVASFVMCLMLSFHPPVNPIRYQDKLNCMFIGIVGIALYNITLNYGEQQVSAGVASFFVSISPLLTSLLAMFFLNEQPFRHMRFSFILVIIGLMFLLLGEKSTHPLTFFPVICLLLTACFSAIYIVLQRLIVAAIPPLQLTTYFIWGGTLGLLMYLPSLLLHIANYSLSTHALVIYLGVFPAAISYLTWSYVLMYLEASTAAMYLYLNPFIATIMGYLLLGEKPALLSLLGGICLVMSVLIAHIPKILGNARN